MADSRDTHIWFNPDGTAVRPEDKKSMGGEPPCLFREEGRPEPPTPEEWAKLNERHLALEAAGKAKVVEANLQAGMTLADALTAAEKAKAPKADAPAVEEV